MDNFTPLKTKKKERANKFLIVGNIFLVMALIFMTNFFLKDKLISTQEKAAVPLPTRTPTRTPTPTPSKTPTPTVTATPTREISLSPTINPTVTLKPTEIVIAKISTSPTAVVSLPKTGTIKSFIYIVPALIMLIGLIL
ncbi:hypothetical protein HZA75_00245 [Candidatus Roizmanbacteria bacterium]|nr:hypothetical protein [Candidatus Roizmanbacteria bacterium]